MRAAALFLLVACADPPLTPSQQRSREVERRAQALVAACVADGGNLKLCDRERVAAAHDAGCLVHHLCMTKDGEDPGSVLVCP
jgi:hypothetical protein